MTSKIIRLKQLDFLRGLAILLVMFRHQYINSYLDRMGWIGVDLFFVLSGFLVSGLLFKEYEKFGDINPKLFLIRRGFKIYPLYYIALLFYFLQFLRFDNIDFYKIFSEIFFFQNYTHGWGYLNQASWSLAIEEHFYFLIVLSFYWAFKNKIINHQSNNKNISIFEKSIYGVLILCLILRYFISFYFTEIEFKHKFTMTHLRLDSLLFGVLISYYIHFKYEILLQFYTKFKKILFLIALLFVSWTPFVVVKDSYFIVTIGFTLLYIAFGILLVSFLLEKNIVENLNKYLSKKVVELMSKIGFASYSIYLFHSLVIFFFGMLYKYKLVPYNRLIFSILSISLSLISGVYITKYIEEYFLNLREKYFPRRS